MLLAMMWRYIPVEKRRTKDIIPANKPYLAPIIKPAAKEPMAKEAGRNLIK